MEKLRSDSIMEQGRLLSVCSLLQELHTYFALVQRRVGGAHESVLLMITVDDERYLQLLQKLRCVTLDTDDMLDRVSHQLRKAGAFCACQVCSSFILRQLPFHRFIARKLRLAIASLQDCYAQTYRIRAKHRDIQDSFSSLGTCGIGPDEVYGRARDVDDVIRMLQADDDTGGLSVVPILGIARIGKTTLAQLVFRHPWAVKTFGNDRIWVFVSQHFDIKMILRNMVESLTSEQCDVEDSESLERLVRYQLSGRRFLLVLDDVWNEDCQKWQLLMEVIHSAGRPGSKMIVTTRIADAATMMSSVRPYTLQPLSPADSWKLLTQRIQDPMGMPPRLLLVGRKIM